MGMVISDDATPPPVFPMTFETANLTLKAMAGTALYIGSTVQRLHEMRAEPDRHDWAHVASAAAEAECSWATALQRLARSERPRQR